MMYKEIHEARSRVDIAEDQYLRSHGWRYTCNTPGAYWLWSGKLPDGREVLCDTRTAVSLQASMTPDPDPFEDDDEAPLCPEAGT